MDYVDIINKMVGGKLILRGSCQVSCNTIVQIHHALQIINKKSLQELCMERGDNFGFKSQFNKYYQ